MPTLLCIDAGNSRVKWQVRHSARVIAEGALELAEPVLVLPESVLRLVEGCAISAVSTEKTLKGLVAQLAELGLPPPRVLRAERSRGPLTNGYSQPEKMGVDRWLAMVAATQHLPLPLVVVDAGTATTVDPIDTRGAHLGGFILLGMRGMLAALGSATAKIASQEFQSVPRLPRTSETSEAVCAGAVEATRGLVERAIRMLNQDGGPGPRVVVTGGDGLVLTTDNAEYLWRRNLVLQGVEIVANAEDAEAESRSRTS